MKKKAVAVVALVNACARTANTIAIVVDITAASCGELPNGTAAKSDQLAKDTLLDGHQCNAQHALLRISYPQSMWTTRIKAMFVPLNI